MNYEQWMSKAIATIETEIQSGRRFEVKQLFPGHEWESLSTGERRSFGKYFSDAVREGRLPTITRYGEGNSHHNQYIKE